MAGYSKDYLLFLEGLVSSTLDASILPALTGEHPPAGDQVDDFRRDGHLVVPGVCTPAEVSAYREHIGAAVRRLNQEHRPLEQRDTYGKAFLQVWNIWLRDPAVARFVLAHRFAKMAADLMGVDGVRLYHDQALFKEPGGGHTPWHQDRYYWPLDTDRTVTMWMPLVDVEAGMEFATGSHRNADMRGTRISDDSDAHFTQRLAETGAKITAVGPLRAGDATFHDGWMVHRAPGNRTGAMREVMTIIYFAEGTRVGPADSDERRADLGRWLPGLQPGDLAASDINPLLYHRAG
jgi:ectoine hydroxylase-related dioxygenase (phytanoyl-CoA dioxygenase family)